MARKLMPSSQLPDNIETHLHAIGEFYMWADLNDRTTKPPVIPINGNMYYRFMNFFYLPQPPESLTTEKVVEICDLRLDHSELINYEHNGRVVEGIANYLLSIFPHLNSSETKKKALDFGCGSGLSLQLLNKHFLGLDIVGVDISKKAIQCSQEQGLKTLLIEPDERLPFEAHSFDLIFAIFVMHFKIDLAMLSELKRILHPEGKYVFNLYQRKFDGVEEELLEAGFSTVEIIDTVPGVGEDHLIVSCSNISL